MSRLAGPGQFQHVQFRFGVPEQSFDFPPPLDAMVTPCAYDQVRFACRLQDRGVVAGAHRVLHLPQGFRIGRAPAENVGHDEGAVAPRFGIGARPRTGRVERRLVGGARIEHQEVRHRERLVPAAPEQVAPAAASREHRARIVFDDSQATITLMKSKNPRSAGAVVFRRTDRGIRVLILRAFKNWDFPKGLVDPGEEQLAAAKREVEEETGLGELDWPFGEEFKETLPYGDHKKVARYYLCETGEHDVKLPVSPELGRP